MRIMPGSSGSSREAYGHGKLGCELVKGLNVDVVGTPLQPFDRVPGLGALLEDLLEANRLILETFTEQIEGDVDEKSSIEGKVVIEPGAIIRNSVVRGPAVIGNKARIEQAYIGPFTAIMNDVQIQGSEIEHSIVLEGAVITDVASRIVDSLIGKNVRIYRQPMKPSAYRFMLGDNSEVGIRW